MKEIIFELLLLICVLIPMLIILPKNGHSAYSQFDEIIENEKENKYL